MHACVCVCRKGSNKERINLEDEAIKKKNTRTKDKWILVNVALM